MFDLPTPAALFGVIVFSVVGFAAFMYGRKHTAWRPLALGIALMVYPYFVTQTWLVYAVGCALCAGLYVFRE